MSNQVATSASLVVTGALLVVTKKPIRISFKKNKNNSFLLLLVRHLLIVAMHLFLLASLLLPVRHLLILAM